MIVMMRRSPVALIDRRSTSIPLGIVRIDVCPRLGGDFDQIAVLTDLMPHQHLMQRAEGGSHGHDERDHRGEERTPPTRATKSFRLDAGALTGGHGNELLTCT